MSFWDRQDRPADLVERDFTACRPDELWFADFTYLRCWEGVVYFAFVIDASNRAIVGWQFATHMRTDLVLDALRMALAQRGAGADVQLIHHSDAGSQYRAYDYTQTLDDHGVLASIGSVGDAFDNAAAESFVDSFKTELIRDRVWRILEVTEHAQINDYFSLEKSLRRLRAYGARLAVDDVGAGFATLRHILGLCPDMVKLDVSLIRDIDGDPWRRALAASLVTFAREIDAAIVAEGIETIAEFELLRELGIRYGQGFYLGRPQPLLAALTSTLSMN